MAKKTRLSPNKLAEVKASFAGLKSITNYVPVKSEFKVSEIEPVEAAIDDLTAQEAQLLAQLGDVRDRLADKGTEFTQKMKGAGQQVIAQFGDDSAEIQMLGRKRTSERAARKSKKGGGQPS